MAKQGKSRVNPHVQPSEQRPMNPTAVAKHKQSDRQKGQDTFHAHDHGGEQHHLAEKGRPDTATGEQAHDHAHEGHDHTHEVTDDKPVRGEQKVTIEDTGPARKALTIEVPAERIQQKIESSFGRLKNDAVLPGFRRGRAPQRLLEKRFGTSIRDDVRNQLLSECYTQAVEDEKLDVIGEPDVKDFESIKLPESGPLTFRVEVEISPKVELPSLEGIEVKKTKMEVTDDQVAEELGRLAERYGKMTDVPGATVGEGDYIQGDVRILAGADADVNDTKLEPVAHYPGSYVQAHGEKLDYKGHVAGIVVNDLGKRLYGKKAGELVTISTTGPATHEHEKIKNQPITLAIRIDKVERLEPADQATLHTQLGAESLDHLKTRVKEALESRRDRDQQAAMHEQVANHLLDKVTLELPKGLTGRQTARVLRRRALELSYRGVSQREIESQIADMRQSSEEDATKQLRLFFILDQAAKDLDVDVSESELNGRIAMLAMQQGRRPEKLRQEMQRSGEVEHLYLQIREQKTLDKILEKAKVTEGPVAAPAKEEKEEKKEKKAEKKAEHATEEKAEAKAEKKKKPETAAEEKTDAPAKKSSKKGKKKSDGPETT